MYSAINKNHPNEFYCRECRAYLNFTQIDEINLHYMSHIRFLESLIHDLDKEQSKEEYI